MGGGQIGGGQSEVDGNYPGRQPVVAPTPRPTPQPAPKPAGAIGIPGLVVPPDLSAKAPANADAQYRAYVRGLQLQQQQAYGDFARQYGNIGTQTATQLADMSRVNAISQKNLNNTYGARGMWSSGEHAQGLGNMLADQGARQAAVRQAQTQAYRELFANLQNRLNALAQQRAAEEVNLAVRLKNPMIA
jgi:hypothetical protein